MLRWHYEGRHERNATPSVPVEGLDDTWVLLPEALSAYHQDPDLDVELKFVKRDDGSPFGLGSYEAIWDPNERVWLEAGAFGSTYNYVSPRGVITGIGHFVFDVVPYWFLGTDRGTKHRSFLGRVTGR
ncbi:MAG: hypothetical protein WBL35_06380 [Ornithinibacter sp.]